MSYDLFFFAYAGSDPQSLKAVRDLHENRDDGQAPEFEAQRRAVIEELLALHPSLKFEPSASGDSSVGWIGSDDHSCPYPDVDLYPRYAFTGVPYSADAEKAQRAFDALVAAFAKHTFVAYDPQIDRTVLVGATDGAQAGAIAKTRDAVVSELERRGEVVIGPAQERRSFLDQWPRLIAPAAAIGAFAYLAFAAYLSFARPQSPIVVERDVLQKHQARIKQLAEAARQRASDARSGERPDGAPSHK